VDAGVREQVVDDLAKAGLAADDDQSALRVDLDRPFRVRCTRRVDGGVDHRGQVDRMTIKRQALVEPCEE